MSAAIAATGDFIPACITIERPADIPPPPGIAGMEGRAGVFGTAGITGADGTAGMAGVEGAGV
jgi:hypothetical protein